MENTRGQHLLSLKVMRVSRPSLASAWQPFYSSSPSFSAHSTASILSLQGNTPLPGHPKTLRDLTHASELLTLPASFGAIQLGETFSSCLCVNNEAQVEIEAVTMKVEMQTVTSKVLLAEFGGSEFRLAAADALEHVVHHEIKELGQHVLACTVSYKLPPSSRNVMDEEDTIQTFRKFYKFAVTNPLSVKTKVHTPRSPSALLSLSERDKVFLEVHIQNLTQDPLWFETMRFNCVEGWKADDINVIELDDAGPNTLLQPQDMRQYIYILTPSSPCIEPPTHTPGSIIPLGRLDLSWRSSFGEPGRLLTSMLSRRVPLPPPVQTPASALPPYLKKVGAGPGALPLRPRSPQLVQSQPGSRPGSPFQNRPLSSAGRPQSPVQSPTPTAGPPFFSQDLEVNLVVRDVPGEPVKLERPFKISFTLAASSPIQTDPRRIITLAVQHLQSSQNVGPPLSAVPPPQDAFSPRFTSPGFSTPSPTTSTTFNYALAHQKLLVASPRLSASEEPDFGHSGDNFTSLPAPFFEADGKPSKPPGVMFYGSSTYILPPLELLPSDNNRVYGTQDFDMSYIPVQTGFSPVGGLRVLLLNDRGEEEENTDQVSKEHRQITRTLKEWDVVAEVWVST
ncbi:DUF974-domain-containing protein [Mycena floridula]|nr:DUF974-domain-containing protein [Mycena floridula]